METYADKVRNMQWSYSRLSCYEKCKYAFYLQYILKDFETYPSESNFWAENGTAVHETFADIATGIIVPAEAEDCYWDLYDKEVIYRQKPATVNKAVEQCATYFRENDFRWLNDYHILGVELEVKFRYKGYNFTGFVDLLLQRKSDNKIFLIDHKSCKYFFRKDGKLKADMTETFYGYQKQMYMYCLAIRELYGFTPDYIVWNHFREQTWSKGELLQAGKFSHIEFNEDEFNATIDWIFRTIHAIENETIFCAPTYEEMTEQYFYCTNLCNFRHSCEYCLDRWKMSNTF